MAKQKFQKGEKVKIYCLTDQLRLIQCYELSPGNEVYILKKQFRDKDKYFYQVSNNPKDKEGYILPENYLTKINQ